MKQDSDCNRLRLIVSDCNTIPQKFQVRLMMNLQAKIAPQRSPLTSQDWACISIPALLTVLLETRRGKCSLGVKIPMDSAADGGLSSGLLSKRSGWCNFRAAIAHYYCYSTLLGEKDLRDFYGRASLSEGKLGRGR